MASMTEVWDSKTCLELIKKKVPFYFSPNMTSLDFSKTPINTLATMQIAYALKGNNTLQRLYLSGEKITDLGTLYILNALRDNCVLTSLAFEGNKISDFVAGDVAFVLKFNSTISELKLIQNQLTDKGAQLIAVQLKENNTLTNLHIEDNKIQDEGTLGLIEVLRRNSVLQKLTLDGVKMSDTCCYVLNPALSPNRTLTYLSLNDNHITDVGFAEIMNIFIQNPNITTLNFSGNKITERGAGHVANMLITNKTLTSLDISRNQLKDTGIFYLIGALKLNSSIIALSLSDTGITDKSCTNICELLLAQSNLLHLNLSANRIEDKGCGDLVNALSTLQKRSSETLSSSLNESNQSVLSLLSLNLNNNLITEVGASLVLDISSLISTIISIEGNPVYDESLLEKMEVTVEKALKSNKYRIEKFAALQHYTKEFISKKHLKERILEVSEKSQKLLIKRINTQISISTKDDKVTPRRSYGTASKFSKDFRKKKDRKEKTASGEFKRGHRQSLISRVTHKFHSENDADNEREKYHTVYSNIIEKTTILAKRFTSFSNLPIEKTELNKCEKKIAKLESLVKEFCSFNEGASLHIKSTLEGFSVAAQFLVRAVENSMDDIQDYQNSETKQQQILKIVSGVMSKVKQLTKEIEKIYRANSTGDGYLLAPQNLENYEKEIQSGSSEDTMRDKAIAELIHTEETYGEGLRLTVNHWWKPIKTNLDQIRSIHRTQLSALFVSLESIYNLHLFVLEQLKNKQESLGKIFLNIADTMKLYIDYVNKFESANVIFAELSNDKFFQSMEQKGMELTGKYLRDYLITPIQRLPRYQLALETIIKHTEPTHEHYESLLKAKDKVQSVNIHINEKKRDYENRLRLLELATRIELPSYIVAPHRVCIFEGKMEMEKEGEEKKKVHVYLLNDLWIITEEKNDNQFVYVDKIALNDLSIAFVSQASFILTAGNVSWNCYCATPFEVNKWVNAIEDTLKSNELHDLLGEWDDASESTDHESGDPIVQRSSRAPSPAPPSLRNVSATTPRSYQRNQTPIYNQSSNTSSPSITPRSRPPPGPPTFSPGPPASFPPGPPPGLPPSIPPPGPPPSFHPPGSSLPLSAPIPAFSPAPPPSFPPGPPGLTLSAPAAFSPGPPTSLPPGPPPGLPPSIPPPGPPTFSPGPPASLPPPGPPTSHPPGPPPGLPPSLPPPTFSPGPPASLPPPPTQLPSLPPLGTPSVSVSPSLPSALPPYLSATSPIRGTLSKAIPPYAAPTFSSPPTTESTSPRVDIGVSPMRSIRLPPPPLNTPPSTSPFRSPSVLLRPTNFRGSPLNPPGAPQFQ